VPRAYGRAVGKDSFPFFFEKILCQAPLAKTVGKDGFYFFKKNFLCRAPSQLRSAKLGTPEMGKFVPRVAESNCQDHSAMGPCPTAPLGKEVTFKFFFFPH
jgi:hypothetical protein